MKKDVNAATAEDFLQTPEVKIDFAYQFPGKQNVNNMMPGNTNADVQYAEWIVGIYPSFKNTLAVLKETGYPLTVEDLDIEKIMLSYFNDENGQQEDVTYENQEEIKNIKELADSTNKERLLRLIYELSELANNIKWSSQKAIMFEAGIIKACMEVNVVPQNVVAQEQVVNRKQIAPVQKQENIAVAPKERKIEPQNQRNSAPSASYWNNVINKVKQSGKMAIYVNLIGSKASQLNDMTVEVELANKNDFGREMLEKYENKALVEKFVSEEMRKSYAFKIYY